MSLNGPQSKGNFFELRLKEVLSKERETIIFVLVLGGFFFWRGAPTVNGSSQARGQIRAAADCLHHGHSNAGSKLCLQPTPQLKATLDL